MARGRRPAVTTGTSSVARQPTDGAAATLGVRQAAAPKLGRRRRGTHQTTVNKDNLLFAIIGLLFGFTMGYVLHEIMVARQPLRRLAGEGAVTSSSAAPEDAGAPSAEAGSPAGADPGAATAGGGAAATAADAGAGPGGPGAPGGSAAGGNPPPGMAAVQELRDYVASHPKDADAVLKLANLNFDINNWPRARELYTQYLGLRDPNPDVLTDLGTCYRQLRQFDRALEQFRRAQQVAPGHWKSLFAEVVVLAFDLNQRDAADQAFAKLQAAAPNQPEVAQLRAELQRRRAAAPGGGAGAPGSSGRQGGSGGGR
jgi:hypothetical protein